MMKQLFSLEYFLLWNSGVSLLLRLNIKLSRYFHCYFLWSSFKPKNFYPISHLFSGGDLSESQVSRNPHYANPILIPKLHKTKYTPLSHLFFCTSLAVSSVRDGFLDPSSLVIWRNEYTLLPPLDCFICFGQVPTYISCCAGK